eukprot:gene15940-21129_t
MTTKLSLANLEIIAAKAAVPAYRREQLSPGIVHFGIGNFHRAHMAVYLHELFNEGRNLDWAIIGAGIMGTIGAFSKGAPVRIIGAETTGSGDLFWYVRADSPIQSMKDLTDKTIAYSTAGSSTQGVVNAFMKEMALKAKPTATGSPYTPLPE